MPTPLFEDGQTEFTVHRAASGRFVVVQTVGFGAATIGIRTAPALTGPWSGVAPVWRLPGSWRAGALIYAAKANPELDAEGALAVTYIPSSFDIATVVADETLYYPRFIRLKLSALEHAGSESGANEPARDVKRARRAALRRHGGS